MASKLKKAAVGCGALAAAAGLCFAVFFVWSFVIQPRRIGRALDLFASQHGPGTTAAAAVDDPFTEKAYSIRLDDGAGAPTLSARPARSWSGENPERAEIRARAASLPNGKLTIGWVQVPPFGRRFLNIEISSGVVTRTASSSLD